MVYPLVRTSGLDHWWQSYPMMSVFHWHLDWWCLVYRQLEHSNWSWGATQLLNVIKNIINPVHKSVACINTYCMLRFHRSSVTYRHYVGNQECEHDCDCCSFVSIKERVLHKSGGRQSKQWEADWVQDQVLLLHKSTWLCSQPLWVGRGDRRVSAVGVGRGGEGAPPALQDYPAFTLASCQNLCQTRLHTQLFLSLSSSNTHTCTHKCIFKTHTHTRSNHIWPIL